ncbi:TPA: AAA family ATPase [candidate division WOR-3 bacterium]|uniref:AAA family ATPase n=1 Tax=candidate division WOR-3 bacterium TaxID=2052148 RepID=A0A350HB41_UNCW3|nr:AAA family ATPase [candidate division WOR-3 bacterium]
MSSKDLVQSIHARINDNISRVVIGQNEVVENVLITLLCNSHSIIVGVPGLAKTLIVKLLAKSIDASYSRIQFTPDLMPSDITGTIVFKKENEKNAYEFIKGPIFANILLADEINRTPPKTQSALLQAMEERFVTAESKEYPLPHPFNVFATQNPIEQEGTYPLPEAQLDRFMFQIEINYPDREAEKKILSDRVINEEFSLKDGIVKLSEITEAQSIIEKVAVASNIHEAVLNMMRNSRPETTKSDIVKDYVKWGVSPRAGIFLIAAAKAKALLDGRLTPDMDDLKILAPLVFKHRIILSFKGEMENKDKEEIINEIIKKSF